MKSHANKSVIKSLTNFNFYKSQYQKLGCNYRILCQFDKLSSIHSAIGLGNLIRKAGFVNYDKRTLQKYTNPQAERNCLKLYKLSQELMGQRSRDG